MNLYIYVTELYAHVASAVGFHINCINQGKNQVYICIKVYTLTSSTLSIKAFVDYILHASKKKFTAF